MPGAHEHRVTWLDGHAAERRRRVEVVAGDRVVLLEVVDTLEARDVDQHAARRDRAVVLDAELRRARVGDRRVGRVVPELALVTDVRERVEVGRRLRAHAEGVVGRREIGRVAGEGDVDRVCPQLGVDAVGHVVRVPLRTGLVERDRE